MINYCFRSLILVALLSSVFCAQTNDRSPQVTTVTTVLISPLETKSAATGQEFWLRTTNDIVVNGEMILPKGSKVRGHIAETVARAEGHPQSELWLIIDKAVNKAGVEISLQAIVAAIAAPNKDSLSSDPTYGMLHSVEPTMRGTGARSASSSGTLAASSKADSNAAVATATLKPMPKESTLQEDSQGVIGYEGLSIRWNFLVPPPITILTTDKKNLKLASGTEMLLRMTPPRLPQ
ncbi:MAG TPA: hypothetical protein VIF64_18650 [Pyrinomonadaceae bacterium]|jgi:hypothetical protein